MAAASQLAAVKLVGANGQISLGKQYAGRHVLIEERESGVWVVRTATVVPDNERWLHEPQAADDLTRAMDWASSVSASNAGMQETLNRLSNDQD